MSADHTPMILFVVMVFIAVFALTQSLIVPIFGEGRKERARLRRRFREMVDSGGKGRVSLIRGAGRDGAAGADWAEGLPGAERLEALLVQSGSPLTVRQTVLKMALFAGVAAVAVLLVLKSVLLALAVVPVAGAVPILMLVATRQRRLQQFEEQLPDGIEVMVRALKAGHPFTESLRLVGEEMQAPLSEEFKRTFTDANYGGDMRTALLGLLARVPSVTVMAFVTAVLVQREVGGNLAEVLTKISTVVRGRFRFQRRVRTLSAEARMSAWILTLIPFVLFVAITITQPNYMPMLTKSAEGQKIIALAFGMMLIGVLWMRRIIRIRV